MQQAESSETPITYTVGERCLCYHGQFIYEAKILKSQYFDENTTTSGFVGTHYFVHYKGWKQTWDEFVPTSRLMKFNEKNIAHQKDVHEKLRAANPSSSASKTHPKGAGGGHKDGAGGVGTRAAGRKDGARGTKRAREEDDTARKPEMKLDVPEILKVMLVDDWEAVTKNSQLVTLPRTPTVEQLLQEFEEYVKTTKPQNLRDPTLLIHTVASGLQIYFDRSCGSHLLYRNERVQYADIRKQYITGQAVIIGEEKEMSAVYGAEHLLRMLVTLPQMIASSAMDPESVGLVRDYVNELLRYMERERARIFQAEYDTSSPPYQNITRS